jgi:hypothetical protein
VTSVSWSAETIAFAYGRLSANCRPLAFCSRIQTRSRSWQCSIRPSASIKVRAALGLALCATSPFAAAAAECLAPTKQSQLQTVLACTNAMCCPRDLNRQVNLVRAVARKLKSLGYTISDPRALPEDSPDLSGMYYPALRSAVGQYKQDHNIADGNADITYELVATLLEFDLFERWQ